MLVYLTCFSVHSTLATLDIMILFGLLKSSEPMVKSTRSVAFDIGGIITMMLPLISNVLAFAVARHCSF